ncbi:hypothetical protein VNO77_26701 [Canavalia gladiata]|uniref:Uncharacterized protein n=1 Tax=Canavalia gladiata TaxID=3824 RepID=A0AAN9KU15_CANGL
MPLFPPRQEGQYFVPTQDEAPLSPPPTYTFPSQRYTEAGGSSHVGPSIEIQFGFDALFMSLNFPSPRRFLVKWTLRWALASKGPRRVQVHSLRQHSSPFHHFTHLWGHLSPLCMVLCSISIFYMTIAVRMWRIFPGGKRDGQPGAEAEDFRLMYILF